METNPFLNDDAIGSLIAKVFANEANESEMASLRSWRQASAENESYFIILKQIFEESALAKENYTYNVDEAWKKVKPSLFLFVPCRRRNINRLPNPSLG
ncbi:MAG: hypothetical protein IPL74_11585 [Bacteroidetes bacterium]|nr:hypothetical protein [Bacteroidota bacterium]